MNRLEVAIKNGKYEAHQSIIHNVHFTLKQGELLALIGENGAGKSTTIAAIGHRLPYLEGKIQIHTIGAAFGYVPERPVYYDALTLWEHLVFRAAYDNLVNWESRAEALLDRFRLGVHKHELLGSFSKGMQQKAMIALAFLKEHELYVVDEPFVGLDPSAVTALLALIEEERSRGAAILLCTHVLDTAERWCERFVMMKRGTVAFQGTLEQFQKEAQCPNGSLHACFDALL
ncbi:MAG: ABC transporter ATP-binding protein [Bacilli bacterium]